MVIGLHLLRRNAISNAIGIVLPAIAWLVVVPILIRSLGEHGYGVYTIAISFAGILGILELGLTSAAAKYIAEVDIRSDANKLEKIISGNLSIYIGIGGAVILLCFLFTPLLSSLLFRGSGFEQKELASITRLIGVIFAFTLLKTALASPLMGLQRYDIYNVIQTGYALSLAVVQGLIAINGGRVSDLLLGNLVVIGFSVFGFMLALRTLIPGIHLFRLPDGHFLRMLLSFGLYMMLISIEGTILCNVDKLIVGRLTGPENVTYYAIPSQICFKVHSGLAVLISFIFPLASEVQSLGDRSTLKKIFLSSMGVVTLLEGIAMVFFATFSSELLTLWIGEDFADISAPIFILASFSFLFFSLSITPYHMLLGMGYPGSFALLNSFAIASVICCLSIGTFYFGVYGGAAGAMLGMVTMAGLPWYTQRKLGISWEQVFKSGYGRNLLVSILGIGIGTLLPMNLLVRTVFFIGFLFILIYVGDVWGKWRFILPGDWLRALNHISIWASSRRR
jgi:O-antigen/teichoic acid export membrane protein